MIPGFETTSPWWLLLCGVAALIYAYFQYQGTKKKIGSKSILITLFIARFLVVTVLSALLLSPLLKQSILRAERPIVVLAMDNSASIAARQSPLISSKAFETQYRDLVQTLSKNYDLKTYSFGQHITDGLHFSATEKETDLSGFLTSIYNTFENRNLGAIVVASDGIINSGADPLNSVRNHPVPVYTIALGNAVPLKDLAVVAIRNSDIVYEGEPFTLEVFLKATEAKGLTSQIKVEAGGKQIFSRVVKIPQADFSLTVPVKLIGTKVGFTQYTVTFGPASGEMNTVNNRKTVLVETLKGKLRILLLAGAPHPDLTSIKEELQNYKRSDVDLFFETGHLPAASVNYDLVILHQVPFLNTTPSPALSRYLVRKTPIWFMFGSQSDVTIFNQVQHNVMVMPGFTQTEMQARLNQNFTAFILSDSSKKEIGVLPPLLGPLNSFKVNNLGSSLLNVSVPTGSLAKEEPLLFFSNRSEGKSAYLMGEGLWRWNLKEYDTHVTHKGVQEIISQTVQYLTAEADQRKFRITMPEHVYSETQSVELDAELLNDNFERINAPDAFLKITDSKNRTYSFTFSKTENSYTLKAGTLPAGVYTYTGSVSHNDRTEHATGSFVILATNLEAENLNANHSLLAALSASSGAKAILPSALQGLVSELEKNQQVVTITHEDEKRDEAINLKWLFFLTAGLLSAEWLTRKFNGIL